MAKILLAGGCSYTDAKYNIQDPNWHPPLVPWPMWPEHLGNALGLDVINTGKSGNDNISIFHSIIDMIYENESDIEAVVILWSGAERVRGIGGLTQIPLNEFRLGWQEMMHPSHASHFNWGKEYNFEYSKFFKSKDFWKVANLYIKTMIEDNLRIYLTVAEICKSKNIKFICAQGIPPLDWWVFDYLEKQKAFSRIPNYPEKRVIPKKSEMLKMFINNPISNNIQKYHKNNFIGWPFWPELSGNYLDHIRHDGAYPFNRKGFPFEISKLDRHPNALGQELIAKWFYEHYKKLYNE